MGKTCSTLLLVEFLFDAEEDSVALAEVGDVGGNEEEVLWNRCEGSMESSGALKVQDCEDLGAAAAEEAADAAGDDLGMKNPEYVVMDVRCPDEGEEVGESH